MLASETKRQTACRFDPAATALFMECFDPERPVWVLGAVRRDGAEEWKAFAGDWKPAVIAWLAARYTAGEPVWFSIGDVRAPNNRKPLEDDIKAVRYIAAHSSTPDVFLSSHGNPPHAVYQTVYRDFEGLWRLPEAVPLQEARLLSGRHSAGLCDGKRRVTPHPLYAPLPSNFYPEGFSGGGGCMLRMPTTWLATRFTAGRPERQTWAPGTKQRHDAPFAWSATDITAEDTDWLWQDVIERGSMTLLSGQPKMGKSQIAQFIASTVSQGGQWPTGERVAAGNVLVIDYEDNRATIKARMEASGADLSRVRILGKGDQILDLSQRDGDMRRLAEFARSVGGLALLTISPGLTLFGQTSHDEVTVRAKLAPLLDWAAKEGTAVIFILHPPKNPKADVTAQFAGSDTYRRAARGAWVVMTDPDDKHPNVKLKRRVMLCAGVNNGRDDLELRYRITDAQTPSGVRTSRIQWLSDEDVFGSGDSVDFGDDDEGQADAPIMPSEWGGNDESGGTVSPVAEFDSNSEIGFAKTWIIRVLRGKPPVEASKTLLPEAEKIGIKRRTFYRAGEALERNGILLRTPTPGMSDGDLWSLKEGAR